jgi:hypothetical protein
LINNEDELLKTEEELKALLGLQNEGTNNYLIVYLTSTVGLVDNTIFINDKIYKGKKVLHLQQGSNSCLIQVNGQSNRIAFKCGVDHEIRKFILQISP